MYDRKFKYDSGFAPPDKEFKGSLSIVDEFIVINTEDFEKAEVFLPLSDQEAMIFITKAGDRPAMKFMKAGTMSTLVSMWIGTFPSALREKLRKMVRKNYKPLKWE